jgi:hypothetical protein
MSAEFRLSAHLPISAIDGGHELGIRLVTSEGALFAALERIGRIEGLALSGTDRNGDVALTSPFRLPAEISSRRLSSCSAPRRASDPCYLK